MSEKYYKTQTWLNPLTSSSTGAMVCYDGMTESDGKPYRVAFVEIADCYGKVKLHRCEDDSIEDFIRKVALMEKTLHDFREHLIARQNKEHYVGEIDPLDVW